MAFFLFPGRDSRTVARKGSIPSRFLSQNPFNEEAKALLKTEDGGRGLCIAGRVFTPHTFSEKLPNFSSRHYVFLRHYSLETPLEDAAEKAELTVEQAERFLDRKDVREWLADRALKSYIKQEWEVPGKLYKELDDVYEGRKVLERKSQMEALKLLAERVAPPRRSTDGQGSPSYTFNFGVDAVKAAFDRQKAIDAEVAA